MLSPIHLHLQSDTSRYFRVFILDSAVAQVVSYQPRSVPGQWMWICVDKWHGDMFFSEYFGFTSSL
jgi:hypothetical protein